MKQREKLKLNLFIAMLAATGMACKPIISPVVNLITDGLLIPGGSAVAGVSLAFLLVGGGLMPGCWTATKMGLLQGILSLLWGMGGMQGPLVFISYTLPGLVIDLFLHPVVQGVLGERVSMGLGGICGVMAGALLTNAVFFTLNPIPLLLFLAVGGLSGWLGSQLAAVLVERLRPIFRLNITKKE